MPSKKILEAKQKIVSDLVVAFKEAKSFVFVDARGLTVLEDTEMRADFRKNNIVYEVIKNTTLTLVFKELGIDGLDEVFKGPTAVAYSTEDIIAPARMVKQYADKYENLSIKAGILEDKAISMAEVNALASIPSKEVLYGQVVYGLISPIAKLAIALHAIAEKRENEGEVSTSAVTETAEPAPAVVAAEEATTETVSE